MLSAQYRYTRKSMSLQLRARTNTKATPKGSRRNRKEQYLSWAFILPALTLLLIFLIIPFVLTIYFSLTNQRLALPAIMFLSIWQGVGLYMIIYLAGLQNIPESLFEAARVDGAGRWQQLWYITLPQLRNTTFFVMIATTVQAFKLYTQVEVMTQGGPNNATTTVVWYMVNQSIRHLHVGYASAVAVVFFLIVLIRVIPILRYVVKAEKREV